MAGWRGLPLWVRGEGFGRVVSRWGAAVQGSWASGGAPAFSMNVRAAVTALKPRGARARACGPFCEADPGHPGFTLPLLFLGPTGPPSEPVESRAPLTRYCRPLRWPSAAASLDLSTAFGPVTRADRDGQSSCGSRYT